MPITEKRLNELVKNKSIVTVFITGNSFTGIIVDSPTVKSLQVRVHNRQGNVEGEEVYFKAGFLADIDRNAIMAVSEHLNAFVAQKAGKETEAISSK